MFGVVMKEKKVLLLVDLRDNKLEVLIVVLIFDDIVVFRDVLVLIFLKEVFFIVKLVVVFEFWDFIVDKYKKNFFVKFKMYVIRK